MTKRKHLDLYDSLFRQVALNDDNVAFKALFDHFFSPLSLYVYRYVDQLTVAEDIVQEQFYQLWVNRKEIRITHSISNYLMTNVKNRAIDYLRHKKVKESYFQKSVSLFEEKEEEQDLYDTIEVTELLMKALGKLAPTIRETFEMNRFQGFTYQEIALKKQLSIKTIEGHISKTLQLLRVELRDYLT